MANNFFNIKNGINLPPLSSAPTSPREGDIYFDSTNGLMIYQGGMWIIIGSGGGGGSGITTLTGDVTATGPGSAAATVVSVGGQTAANVAAGSVIANSLSSVSPGTAGSTLIGDDDSYTNFTPASATVKGALSAIDTSFIPNTLKGIANGVATLGSDGIVPLSQLPNTVYNASFATFQSAEVSTNSSPGLSGTSYANFNNSPTLTITPSITGTYRIHATPFVYSASAGGYAFVRVNNTSGGATLLNEQAGGVYGNTGDRGVSVPCYSLYTLTAGTTYVFDLQGKVDASTVYLYGSETPFAMFADGVGGTLGGSNFFISSAIGSGAIGVTGYTNGPGTPSFTVTPLVSGTYKVSANIMCVMDGGAPIVSLRINNTSANATMLVESGAYWYPNTTQTFTTVPINAIYNLTAGQTYVFDYQCAIGGSGAAILGGYGESQYMYCELTSTLIGSGAPSTVASSSSGNFSSTSGSPTPVTNLSVNIVSSGVLPVDLYLQNDGSGNPSYVGSSGSTGSFGYAEFSFLRNGTVIGTELCEIGTTPFGSYLYVPASSVRFTDLNPPVGTNTYSVEVAVFGAANVDVAYAKLVAREVSSFSSTGGGGTVGPFTVLTQQSSTPTTPASGFANLYSDASNGIPRLRFQDSNGFISTVNRDTFAVCYNNTGSSIPKGSIVYVNGSFAGSVYAPTVALAIATSQATIGFGIAAEAIANGAYGHVQTAGLITSIDMSAFTGGTKLYLSSTTAGALSSSQPTVAGSIIQQLGFVTNPTSSGSFVMSPMILPGSIGNYDGGSAASVYTTGFGFNGGGAT